MHTEDFVEEITNKSKIYIARWLQPKESPGYFHARILFPIISIQGRKGDENYAIYTTISRAGGQADGLAHIPEKL